MSYTVYLDYGTGWVNLSEYGSANRDLVRQDRFTKIEQLHKDLSPVRDKARLTLDYDLTLFNTLLTLDYDQVVKVYITKDGADWFSGVARPVTSFTVGERDDVVEIEALDNGYLLEKTPSTGKSYTDQTVTQIVEDVLTEAGYASSEHSVSGPTETVSYFAYAGDSRSYWDILEDLLYSYGFVFYFDTSGVCRVYEWAASDTTATDMINESVIMRDAEISRDDTDYDSVQVKYRKVTSESKTLVSRDYGGPPADVNNFNMRDNGDTFPAETYHRFNDGAEDAQVLGYSDFRLSTAYFKSGSFSIVAGPLARTVTEFPYPTPEEELINELFLKVTASINESDGSMTLQYENGAAIDGNYHVKSYNLTATVNYRKIGGAVKYPSGVANSRVLDIDGEYIYSETLARRLATALYHRLTDSVYKYRFASENKYDVGQYAQIQLVKLNADATVRIISRRLVYQGGVEYWEYEAEGVQAIDAIFGVVTGGNYGVVASPADLQMLHSVREGLAPGGYIKLPVMGSFIDVNDFEPGTDGLFFDAAHLGFWDQTNGRWPVVIENDDGTAKAYFGDGGTNLGTDSFLRWTGSALEISGAARISGTVALGDTLSVAGSLDVNGSATIDGTLTVNGSATIDGTLTVNSGLMQSGNYSTGSAGWQLNGAGDAELNNVTVRGALIAGAGSSISGGYIEADTIQAGAIAATNATLAKLLTKAAEITGALSLGTGGSVSLEVDENNRLVVSAAETSFTGAVTAVSGELQTLSVTDTITVGTASGTGTITDYSSNWALFKGGGHIAKWKIIGGVLRSWNNAIDLDSDLQKIKLGGTITLDAVAKTITVGTLVDLRGTSGETSQIANWLFSDAATVVNANWTIPAGTLYDSAYGIALVPSERRVEIRNTGNLKVALGYLDGVESYTSSHYGLYLGPNNVIDIQAEMSVTGQDFVARDNSIGLQTNENDPVIYLGADPSGTSSETGAVHLYETGTLGGSIWATAGLQINGESSVDIGTGSTTALTIDSSQRVGIGTSDPNAKLHVQNGDLLISNDTTTGGSGVAKILFSEYSDSGANTNFSIEYNGDFYSGDDNRLSFISEATGEVMRLMYGGDLHFAGGYGSSGVTIDSNGNINLDGNLTTSNNGLLLTTPHGWTRVGPQNSSYSHFTTDRPAFYFNEDITVNGDIQVHNRNTKLSGNDISLDGILFHYDDTDTYMQFHTADQWRVVTGGAERLEVNNSNVTVNHANLVVNQKTKLKSAWDQVDLTDNSFYAQTSTDGFAFGHGTGVSTWFSWDSTNGQNRAIDVWNDGSKIAFFTDKMELSPSQGMTLRGHATFDNGTSTYLTVVGDDSGEAVIQVYGDSQGTGRLYVGQSSNYGGGILYNGDGSPDYAGSGSDYVALYRRSSGTSYWTARNYYGNNNWEFRGALTVGSGLNVPDAIYHSGDSNTYIQFHAEDQWRVVTGGTERLEANNNGVGIGTSAQAGYALTVGGDAKVTGGVDTTGSGLRVGSGTWITKIEVV